MSDFLLFYDSIKNNHGFDLQISHNSISDWCIVIGFKITHHRCGEVIVDIQDCDMQLAFAKAQVQLKQWLTDNCGGY